MIKPNSKLNKCFLFLARPFSFPRSLPLAVCERFFRRAPSNLLSPSSSFCVVLFYFSYLFSLLAFFALLFFSSSAGFYVL